MLLVWCFLAEFIYYGYKSMFTPTTVTSSLRPGNSWTIFLYYACWSFFDWWKHINMDVTLPFWVIMRSGRRNVMNHIASRGTIFGRSVVGVRGIFFLPWVILQRERHHDHIWIFKHSIFFYDVSSAVGLCPYMGNGCVYGRIWFPPSLHRFLGCIKNHTPYYS